jgi:enoyl-CoA hydratase/carnithine racemase
MDETIATFDRMSDLDEVRVVVLAGAELCCGNDSKEAMRAFVEKRPPQFTGT